jgi:restriction system protein
MKFIVEQGGQAPARQVLTEAGKRVPLDEWATTTYETTGAIRWHILLRFHTLGFTKAGYLVKKQGVWYITPEGEEALKLGPVEMFNSGDKAYRLWREQNPKQPSSGQSDTEETTDFVTSASDQAATLEEMQTTASEGIKQRLFELNAYEFQDLVAALLRAMGYFTPFIAPKGKDGGVDVVAYQDPLGAISPRIKVQIKHRQMTPASVQEIRELVGLLGKVGDIGIFVSSGGFTTDARAQSRNSHVHVELVELPRCPPWQCRAHPQRQSGTYWHRHTQALAEMK